MIVPKILYWTLEPSKDHFTAVDKMIRRQFTSVECRYFKQMNNIDIEVADPSDIRQFYYNFETFTYILVDRIN